MYNTPSSRTSKHGSSRKSQHNNRQNKYSPAKPSTPDTTTAIMDAPAEATVEEPKLGFDPWSPEVQEMRLEDEESLFGQQALATEVDEGGELSVLPPLSGSRGEQVHVAFDPFVGVDDAPVHDTVDNSIFELHDDYVPPPPSSEPAAVDFAGAYEMPVERPEPSFGALSDISERAQEVDDAEGSREGAVEVTGAETMPSPPPQQRETARTRAPILVPRTPSSPSTLSRQLQSVQQYLPTSPQLSSLGFSNPLSNFAAPRISNVTVSGSSFNRPSAHPTSDPFVSAKEARRRSTGNYGERDRDRNRTRPKMTSQAPRPDDSDEDILPPTTAVKRTRYPSTSRGSDKVVFASFAFVSLSSTSPPRRLLFLGYENGLQIWDTTHLGEVQEVLNRRLSGAVVGCDVLPLPPPRLGSGSVVDAYVDRRPLIGIVVEEHEASYLLVYSLATHEVIKKLDFSGAIVSSFQASSSFIVVSTTSPTSLHILCSRSLNILHTIQSRQLATFSRPVSYQAPDGHMEILYSTRQDRPHAVFHLSSRLIAFASAPPSSDASSLKHIYPRMAVPQSPSIQLGPLNVSQADIGNAAMKVGGGLLSGMKALGGMAVAAARGESMSTTSGDVGGGFRKFFSRSAPAATSSPRHERRPSTTSVFSQSEQPEGGSSGRFVSEPSSPPPSDTAHVTILDLQPLLDDREVGRPERLTDFTLPIGQVVASLKFSEDGTSVAVVPSDGGVVRWYQIKPQARALRRSAQSNVGHRSHDRQSSGPIRQGSRSTVDSISSLTADVDEANVPWHVYDLRRGRTSGVIEAVNYSRDGRWTGVCTRKRTVHIFATNPYGGKSDEASHIEGRVRNVNELQQPLSTELRPIVRLRANPVTTEQIDVPLAFTFLPSSAMLPTKFLPSHTTLSPPSVPTFLPSSSPPKRRQQSVSPRIPTPTNHQDILLFDPIDGSLSLRRISISSRAGDSSSSIFSSLPIPAATSISLPGMGFIGRASPSPPKPGVSIPTPQASSEQLPMELVAKDSTVATWNLSRDAKWNDVKVPLIMDRSKQRKAMPKSEWLAQAELSTCSRSPLILPSSIFLSHQFSFFALGEDYHALLRRWHFDIPAIKIEVRREVEASAYTAGQGELFVSAGTSPQDVRLARSTLDEPLATAIHSGLNYSGVTPPVIPMLPNGARSGSFKATIPIRSVAAGITEGVTGSLGRLGRGIKKVRSPKLRPQSGESTPGIVPLEFDEEDEALVTQDEIYREPGHSAEHEHENDNDSSNDADMASNSGGTRDSRSISTPSTNNNAPLAESGSEDDGWGPDEVHAVEEAEQFDEISAAGFMDEEQMPTPSPGFRSGPGQKRAGRRGR